MRFWKRPSPEDNPAAAEEAEQDDSEIITLRISRKLPSLAATLGFKIREVEAVPFVVWTNKAQRPATETEVALHERIVALEDELLSIRTFMADAARVWSNKASGAVATPPPAPKPAPTPTLTATPSTTEALKARLLEKKNEREAAANASAAKSTSSLNGPAGKLP